MAAVTEAAERPVVVRWTSGLVGPPWLDAVAAVRTWSLGQTAGAALGSVRFGDGGQGGVFP